MVYVEEPLIAFLEKNSKLQWERTLLGTLLRPSPTHTPEDDGHTRGPHWNMELEPEKNSLSCAKKPELPQKAQELNAPFPILESKSTLCKHPRVRSTRRPEPYICSPMAAGVLQKIV